MEGKAASFNPAVPVSRYPQLSFRFTEVLLGKLIPPDSFIVAFEKAKIILSSDLFRNVFIGEVKDVDIGKLDAFLNQNMQVCALNNKSTVTAYAAVYREHHPTTIFFNPWMLLNIVDKERSLPGNHPIRNQLILFLTVKIVHEVSHLLHHASTSVLQSVIRRIPNNAVRENVISALKEDGTFKIIMEKFVLYDDLGEMIERKLFGGVIGAKWHDQASFMDIDDCVLFKSKDDMVGFYVDGLQTLSKIEANNVDFSFVLANPFQVRKTKSFAFMALEGGFPRLSHCADADVDIEVDSYEEDEETTESGWIF